MSNWLHHCVASYPRNDWPIGTMRESVCVREWANITCAIIQCWLYDVLCVMHYVWGSDGCVQIYSFVYTYLSYPKFSLPNARTIAYTHTRVHSHTYVYFGYTYVCVNSHMICILYECTYLHTHTMYVCICVYTYAYTCVCLLHIYTHMFTVQPDPSS